MQNLKLHLTKKQSNRLFSMGEVTVNFTVNGLLSKDEYKITIILG